MKTLSLLKNGLLLTLILSTTFLQTGCDEDEPAKEDTPELITKVTLTFKPVGVAGNPIVVTATDPDGIGIQDIKPDKEIDLNINTTYTLTIQLINGLLDSTDPGYNVTDEVREEGVEHMFFFSWTGAFANPTGNGNIDNRNDPVNYNDEDENELPLPLGLSTTWTTIGEVSTDKEFRIVLKHQPELKSATSTADDGETDVDLEFTINTKEL
jgi:hypothetical protein